MTNKTIGTQLRSFMTVLIFLASSTLGSAAAPPSDASQNKIDNLLTLIEKQSLQLEKQQQSIEAQDQRFLKYQQKIEILLQQQQTNINKLQSQTVAPSTLTATRKQQGKAPSTPLTPKAATTPTYYAKQSAQETAKRIKPVGRPPEPPKKSRPPEVAPIFDQPGVLTPKGALILEPSLQYTNSTNKRISLHGYTIIPAITIGLINVLAITRDTYVAALSVRYGLTNRLELQAKIPYVYRYEESSTTPLAETTDIENSRIDGNALGDIDFGLRYQLNQPQGGPYYIAGLRIKSDTGTDPFEISRDPDTLLPNELTTGSGFWGAQASLSAILPSDPAVFFGSINYLWNVERDVGTVDGENYGKIDPGDAYGFNFGMGLSFNEKASFSFGYDHSILSRNKQNGEIIPKQVTLHVGTLQLGYSYRRRDKLNINLSLGIGVTEYSPDVQLTLKMPMTL